jgi:hypothetical protein
MPDRGYVPGNVRVISDKANRLKGSRTLPELQLKALIGPSEWRDDYRKIAEYVDREQLLQGVWAKATQPGRVGKEWEKIAVFLDRIFSRGLPSQELNPAESQIGTANSKVFLDADFDMEKVVVGA